MKRNVSKNGNEKHLGKEKKKVLEKLYWNVQLLGEYALGCGGKYGEEENYQADGVFVQGEGQ